MSAEDNVATIKTIYEAFGKGDVETILDAVADDVDWAVDAEPVAPWYGQRSGKDGVASFFADIAGATEVQDFAVEGMGASDNEVFAFLRFAVRMKATGRDARFICTITSGSTARAESSTTGARKTRHRWRVP